MRRWGALVCAAFVFVGAARAASARDDVLLGERVPLSIERSVKLAKGVFVRAPASDAADAPPCVLRAVGLEGATIDLRGFELRGQPASAARDTATGIGLHLVDCVDVTVIGGTFGGFKGCIVAERCRNLKLEDVRFDGWFAQRLLSTELAEDPLDWLAPHDNDAGEWLARYGAAIALTACESAVVAGCRARHGQNGLLLTRCTQARVYDNDFSFLSGWGIALYRSSDNVLARNRVDYCVRGYSHGRYRRGQDSAAILLFERSSDNVIAENSATHSGDGLFLFAGRDLVDGRAHARGEQAPGGCDRNLVFRNDFSFAAANGIEVTFSTENRVLENVAEGCGQHGLWGGYSSRTSIADNSFAGAHGGGLTIEHGQECMIARNVLERCDVALELYWDEDPEFVGGAFGQRRDTASRDHWIIGNSFAENIADLAIEKTTGLWFWQNVYAPSERELTCSEVALAAGESASSSAARELVRGVGGFMPSGRLSAATLRVADESLPEEWSRRLLVEPLELPGSTRPFDPARARHGGLETIVVGEWGPWDFESGEPRPVARSVGGLLAGAKWRARWFSWAGGPDPRGDPEAQRAWRALAGTPALAAEVGVWLDPWAARDDVHAAVGGEHFGLLATSDLELGAGRYRLRVTSDDGVRVVVDGRTLIENWSWHAQAVDEVEFELAAGAHTLDVEYFQIDGGAALALDLLRR